MRGHGACELLTGGSAHATLPRFGGRGGHVLSTAEWLHARLVCWGAVAGGACLLLAACGGQLPPPHAVHDSRRLEADFDQAWDAATRVLAERGHQLVLADRTGGVIETDWLTFNPEYSATIFVTQHEDRYSNCGKPSPGEAFREKQVKLGLVVSVSQGHDTRVTTQARFRTQRFCDPLLWQGDIEGTVECQSRGRLEEEVALQIQLQLIGERLERLRRGMP